MDTALTASAQAIDTTCVNYPAHTPQPARLLAALLDGKKVNPLSGWRVLGIYRLSDTVFQLRKLGLPVITDRLDVQNRFGDACHVAEYFIPPQDIRAAGDGGKAFTKHELKRGAQ